MDDETRRAIEHDCAQLSIAYARAIDFRDYDDLVNLFAEDGELDTGKPVTGNAEIVRAMMRRPDELRSRHVLTNIFVDVVDADTARGISYLTLYRHVGPESLEGRPVDFDAPAGVGHYEDRFVRTGSGWRFKRRKLHFAFRNPAKFQ